MQKAEEVAAQAEAEAQAEGEPEPELEPEVESEPEPPPEPDGPILVDAGALDKDWTELTDEERGWAEELGYDEHSFEETEPPVLVLWKTLELAKQTLASNLGWDSELWDNQIELVRRPRVSGHRRPRVKWERCPCGADPSAQRANV